MAAGTLNIAIEQGATWRRQLTWYDPPPTGSPAGTQGPLKDLTGCAAHMQIRDRIGGTVLVDLTDTAGITLGGVAGTIDIVITAAQTRAITGKKGVYDLYVTFPGDDERRVLEGAVTNDLSVTQPGSS